MKFQLTNGYRPHFDQIARILQYLLTTDDRRKVPRQELVTALGLSDRQIENLTSVAIAFGLLTPHTLILTPLGRAVAQYDSFFDQVETLWIIHYIISSNPQWVIWYRLVNQVIPLNETITAAEVALSYFDDLADNFSERTMREKLPLEIGAVLWAYAQSNLARLNLLHQEETGVFRRNNPADIPPLALLYCLLAYRQQRTQGATAMTIDELWRGADSPGSVLNLPELTLRSLFNQLHDSGLLRLERFGDLDQVRFQAELTQAQVLHRIYGVS